MELDFDKFTKKKQTKFIDDLSNVSGCSVDQIRKVKFEKGCIIFDCEMEKEAAEFIYDIFIKKKKIKTFKKKHPQFQCFLDFLENYKITEVDLGSSITVTINEIEKRDDVVLFVHGWKGDKKSFGKLPDFISEITGCRTLVYDYPTGLFKKSPSNQLIAQNLGNWIRNHIDPNKSKIGIIAHSMGGIITKKMLVLESCREKTIDKNVPLVAFIASPHNGVPMAKMVNVVPGIRKKQLEEITPQSQFLLDLNGYWTKWVKKHSSKGCMVRSIYGTDDGVVDRVNASGNDPDAIPILNAGHIDIVKPKATDDELVVSLSRLIQESGLSRL